MAKQEKRVGLGLCVAPSELDKGEKARSQLQASAVNGLSTSAEGVPPGRAQPDSVGRVTLRNCLHQSGRGSEPLL